MAPADKGQFACSCGALSGRIHNLSPQTGVHVLCFCPDCRAGEVYLDQPDPGTSGVDLVQVSPSDISINTGREHLGLLRLYPTGLLRWYATCCNTPMFTTVATPKIRLVGVRTQRLAQAEEAGRVRARAFVPKRGGKTRHEHPMRMIWPFVVRSLSGLISGAWRDTPFFDPETRKPVVEAKVLTKEERRDLGLGPQSPPMS